MPTDTTVNALVINKLTKAQYDEIQNPSPTELYLVPDEIDNVPTSGSDNPVKSGGIYTALGDKQDTIDSSHKLSADLVDDSSSTNKFTNVTEKGTWNGKQAKITTTGILKGDGNGGVSAALKQDIVDLGIPGTDTNTTYKLTIGNTTRGDSVNGVNLGSIKNKAAASGGTDLSLVTTGEKYTWGNKQETLVSGTNIKTINNESLLGGGNINVAAELPSNLAYTSNDDGEGIIPSDGIRAVTVTSAATMTINPDVVTVINGAVSTSTITLQVPNDNLAHVWDILMTTDSSVAITFAMSNSETILYPNGFSVGAGKAIEISVIGVGTKYYLRYGEFA